MNKKFIEITSRGKKIELNREGIICPQNPRNSDEAPDMEFVNVATAFMRQYYSPRRQLNRKCGSYGLKHVYERATGNYIPNGDFIYAMHIAGFDIVPCNDLSKNCWFNISNTIPKKEAVELSVLIDE